MGEGSGPSVVAGGGLREELPDLPPGPCRHAAEAEGSDLPRLLLRRVLAVRPPICSAFLEESKIAEYIPNRDYFVELALKQSKRCNI
jgi:hypothetical protein